nr:hypothetical protein [Treponemataceae bacterium]
MMQKKKVLLNQNLFSQTRKIFAFLLIFFCFNAFSFAAAVWSGNMGSLAYGDTTEAYMTSDTTFDTLTIYCGEQYFTVDLCGYALSITTLDLGENWKTGQIKFIDSVGGGTVTIGTIDGTNTTWCGYKYIYIDEGVTVTLTTSYNKGGGGDFDIVGDGTLVIEDSVSGLSNIDNISESVTVEGEGANAAYWISKQYSSYFVWSGSTSTDWSDGSNWYRNGSVQSSAPGTSDTALIPTLTSTNQPELTQDVAIASLEIRSSMTLTCSLYTLDLSGDLTANGTITSDTSLTVGGDIEDCTENLTVGSLSVTGSSYLSADVTATGGTITLTGDVTFPSSIGIYSTVTTTISGYIAGLTSGESLTFGSSTYTGSLSLGGNVTTIAGDITFANAVTFTTDATVSTGSSSGSITASSTISSLGTLTMQTGGTIDVAKSITAAGAITVLSADTTTIGNDSGDSVVSSASGAITFGSSTYSGTLTISGNITSTDSNIIFYNAVTLSANATLTSGTADITAKGNFTASSGLSIDGANSTFEGRFACGTGAFTSSSSTSTFLKNADFSECTSFTLSDSSAIIYILNSSTTRRSFKLPSTGVSCDKLYLSGKITVNVDGDLSATTGIYVSDPTSGTYYSTSSFTMRFTGSSTVSTSTLDITRCSATSGVIATIEFTCDVAASTEIYGHSGTYIKINSGYTLSSATYIHSAGNTGLLSTLYVAGNLELTGDLNFCSYYECPEINVASTGKITCANILKTSDETSYHNSTSSYLFINNGEIEVTSSFIFYDDFPYSGSGSVILNGSGSYISNTGSDGISISEIEVLDTAMIGATSGEGSGDIECTTLTSTGLGGKTLTLNRDLVVTGTSSSSLALSGTSESSRLYLAAASLSTGFIVSQSFTGGSYLSIDENIVMKDSSGTVSAYTYTTI